MSFTYKRGEVPAQEKQDGDFELIPDGWYDVLIDEVCEKETKKKQLGDAEKGLYLEFTMTLDGNEKFDGRKIWDRINVENDNPTAEEIGRRKLDKMLGMLGVEEFTGPGSVCGHRVRVRIKTQKGRGEYKDSNFVDDYKRPDGGNEGFSFS